MVAEKHSSSVYMASFIV